MPNTAYAGDTTVNKTEKIIMTSCSLHSNRGWDVP